MNYMKLNTLGGAVISCFTPLLIPLFIVCVLWFLFYMKCSKKDALT